MHCRSMLHLMVPWFSTPNVRPSLGELLSNSQAADAAAVQEGFALVNMCMHANLRQGARDDMHKVFNLLH
jgi:hypothetical protein